MKKITLAFCLTLLIISACDDDFLERYPQTSTSKENFFNSEEDLATYIYGLYNFPGVGIYMADNSTDNAATTGATEIKVMMTGSPSPATITGGWEWEDLRSINFFLENFQKAAITEEALGHYEGLARFFRARFYMEKVKRYSDVPYYDHVLTTDDEDLYKTQDPRAFVVDKIFEDYAYAMEHVRADKAPGLVNKFVVMAYMARHALHEGTYRRYHAELGLAATAERFLQIARDVSQQLMEEGGYSLYSTGRPEADYGNLFNSQNLNDNPEVILGTFSENNLRNSGWNPFLFGNYEVNPLRDLLQDYLMADGSFYSDVPQYETNGFVEEFQSRDPRLSQTYAYPGWELTNTSAYAQGGGIYVQQLGRNFSGYHQIKGFVNNTDQTVQNSTDFPVVRYAEVLLIHAEAKAELGELTQGDLDQTINVIRTRAGMPPLPLNAPVDQVQRDRYPDVTSAQWQVLLEIRRERRIELALEGFRADDLSRWNAGKLLEHEGQGIYFPGLGDYDLTGDDVADIRLIPESSSIPAEKEKNSLGVDLIYYRAGLAGSDASIYLTEGTHGTLVTDPDKGVFNEPKYYYRPVPQSQVVLNPNLKQVFGW